MRLHKILVPVDFSECSLRAVDTAMTLARSFAAEVDILHVWEMSAYLAPEAFLLPSITPASLSTFAATRAGTWMKEFLGFLEAEGVPARGRLEGGAPWSTIVRVAEEERYDLVVLATHGHTNLAHILLGSVAERVVRHAPCPVLTVRGASLRKEARLEANMTRHV